jgi:predicted patatin/cPLA2 family phospholipase
MGQENIDYTFGYNTGPDPAIIPDLFEKSFDTNHHQYIEALEKEAQETEYFLTSIASYSLQQINKIPLSKKTFKNALKWSVLIISILGISLALAGNLYVYNQAKKATQKYKNIGFTPPQITSQTLLQGENALILMGGGISGSGHYGELEYIFQNHINITALGGGSAGVLTSLSVLDLFNDIPGNKEEAQKRITKAITIFETDNKYVDNYFTQDRNSLDTYTTFLKKLHGDNYQNYCNTQIPIDYCIQAREKNGETQLFHFKKGEITIGKLLPYAAASAAIPGIFDPVEIDKKLYEDDMGTPVVGATQMTGYFHQNNPQRACIVAPYSAVGLDPAKWLGITNTLYSSIPEICRPDVLCNPFDGDMMSNTTWGQGYKRFAKNKKDLRNHSNKTTINPHIFVKMSRDVMKQACSLYTTTK